MSFRQSHLICFATFINKVILGIYRQNITIGIVSNTFDKVTANESIATKIRWFILFGEHYVNNLARICVKIYAWHSNYILY